MNIEPVAYFRSPLPEKFGIPRQSGVAASLRGKVVLEPAFRGTEALRGLEGFDYAWPIWGFSLNASAAEGKTTVRPPRLGGNIRVGVFASRSPFRPNPLGLSCVRIEGISADGISVSGADLADGTPIYDIKPYLPYADAHADARAGYTDHIVFPSLEVELPAQLAEALGEDAQGLRELLAADPRPAYQDDPERVYALSFKGRTIRFLVKDDTVIVL
ncbi:MAG: tRNA (N6-threonylcarbamoyladenosine(37)-N6)-methyltransferase TrmO [Bacteroidales bacterium]|nr:tRNA (N6-threonylcarbamoyladenosine(37)-N6)-methyltransferase TrmO [Bacteroidales bacterium]